MGLIFWESHKQLYSQDSNCRISIIHQVMIYFRLVFIRQHTSIDKSQSHTLHQVSRACHHQYRAGAGGEEGRGYTLHYNKTRHHFYDQNIYFYFYRWIKDHFKSCFILLSHMIFVQVPNGNEKMYIQYAI